MKKKDKSDDPKKKGDGASREYEKDEGTHPPEGNPHVDAARIHRDYVERRLGGGAPATPDAYARALEQWQQLPGAVRRPPAEVKGDADAPPKDKDEDEDEKSKENRGPNSAGQP